MECKHIKTCPCVVDICHKSDDLCSIREAVEDIHNDGYKKGREFMRSEVVYGGPNCISCRSKLAESKRFSKRDKEWLKDFFDKYDVKATKESKK